MRCTINPNYVFGSVQTSEQLLWAHVLLQAVADYRHPEFVQELSDASLQALAWLRSPEVAPGSAAWICDALGLSHLDVLRALRIPPRSVHEEGEDGALPEARSAALSAEQYLRTKPIWVASFGP